MAVASYNYNPYSASSRATATTNPYASSSGSSFGTRRAYQPQQGMYSAGRTPWGGASTVGGSFAPPQAGEGEQPAYNSYRDAWTPSNTDKPQYDINAAKRMAYLKGNVGRTAEYDYLSSLKGQTPGFQQAAGGGYRPDSMTGKVVDPLTGNLMRLSEVEYNARKDPNYTANRMGTLFQQLPQYQQYISQLGGLPGQPGNDARWKYFLEHVMARGEDPQSVLGQQGFWGGN